MTVVVAKACNRVYAAKGESLAAAFNATVIDFLDMPLGSIQIFWRGVIGDLTGSFKIYASNLPEVSSFDPLGTYLEGSEIVIHNTDGCRIWIRERLAFRYALVRYIPNGTTDGECDILCLGKKS